MQNVSFYRSSADQDNVARADVPLQVNCCGVVALSYPFTTDTPQGRNDFYLMYVAEGALEVWLDGHRERAEAGDLIIYPPNTGYRYTLSEGKVAYHWLHFTGALAGRLIEQCGIATGTRHHPGLDEEIEGTIRRVQRCFLARGQGYEVECAGYFSALMAQLGRRIADGQTDAPSSNRLRTSLEYLHTHYAQPVSLSELAAMEYMSPSHYSAVFRAIMGASPRQYLIDLRLNAAANLIRSTDVPIKQIAQSIGYADQMYFSRVFRQRMGVTPTEYRAGSWKSPPLTEAREKH